MWERRGGRGFLAAGRCARRTGGASQWEPASGCKWSQGGSSHKKKEMKKRGVERSSGLEIYRLNCYAG